jgi:hypothetical protein
LLPKARTHFGNACRKRFLRFCNESPPFGGHGPLAETLSIILLLLSADTARLHNVLLPKAKTLFLLPKARTHFGNALRQRTPATHFMFLQCVIACRNTQYNASPPFGGHGPLAQCFVAESEDAFRQRTPATHSGNAFHVSAMRHRLQKHSV